MIQPLTPHTPLPPLTSNTHLPLLTAGARSRIRAAPRSVSHCLPGRSFCSRLIFRPGVLSPMLSRCLSGLWSSSRPILVLACCLPLSPWPLIPFAADFVSWRVVSRCLLGLLSRTCGALSPVVSLTFGLARGRSVGLGMLSPMVSLCFLGSWSRSRPICRTGVLSLVVSLAFGPARDRFVVLARCLPLSPVVCRCLPLFPVGSLTFCSVRGRLLLSCHKPNGKWALAKMICHKPSEKWHSRT